MIGTALDKVIVRYEYSNLQYISEGVIPPRSPSQLVSNVSVDDVQCIFYAVASYKDRCSTGVLCQVLSCASYGVSYICVYALCEQSCKLLFDEPVENGGIIEQTALAPLGYNRYWPVHSVENVTT